MTKKKMLFILHLQPPIHGAAMMGQFIVDSKIINSKYDCEYINLGVTKKLKEQKKVTLNKVTHFFKLFTTCFLTYKSFRPDVVYMTLTYNGMGFYKDAIIVWMLKLQGAKFIFHFHNKGIKNNQHKALDNFLYKLILRNADIILCSKWIYPDIEKYVPENEVKYCNNGIPEVEFEIVKRELKSNDAITEILFLANLIETKGVYTLLEACRILNDSNIDFRCSFVGGEGDISSEQLQKEIEQLGLRNKVKYDGKKYGLEKHKAFENADIFAFPTHYPNECFPLVLLEAMQYSLPLISTPEGGIRDIIDDGLNGFMVSQNDSKALARKLETLIKNPQLRHEMGKAGHEKYKQNFTVEIYCHRLDSIFNNL